MDAVSAGLTRAGAASRVRNVRTADHWLFSVAALTDLTRHQYVLPGSSVPVVWLGETSVALSARSVNPMLRDTSTSYPVGDPVEIPHVSVGVSDGTSAFDAGDTSTGTLGGGGRVRTRATHPQPPP